MSRDPESFVVTPYSTQFPLSGPGRGLRLSLQAVPGPRGLSRPPSPIDSHVGRPCHPFPSPHLPGRPSITLLVLLRPIPSSVPDPSPRPQSSLCPLQSPVWGRGLDRLRPSRRPPSPSSGVHSLPDHFLRVRVRSSVPSVRLLSLSRDPRPRVDQETRRRSILRQTRCWRGVDSGLGVPVGSLGVDVGRNDLCTGLETLSSIPNQIR